MNPQEELVFNIIEEYYQRFDISRKFLIDLWLNSIKKINCGNIILYNNDKPIFFLDIDKDLLYYSRFEIKIPIIQNLYQVEDSQYSMHPNLIQYSDKVDEFVIDTINKRFSFNWGTGISTTNLNRIIIDHEMKCLDKK